MIIDITGIILTPGNMGLDCLGNGEHFDEKGEPIPICCDECNYLLCCISEKDCKNCNDSKCPRSNGPLIYENDLIF